MIKIILSLIVFTTFAIAQYGNELVSNGTFNADLTGWTNSTWGTFEYSSGSLHLVWAGPSGYECGGINDANRFTVASGNRYRYKFSLTKNSGTNLLTIWRSSNCGGLVWQPGSFTAGNHTLEWTSDYSGAVSISFDKNASSDWDVDNVSVRQRIDTLWIDETLGSDADDDSVATYAEAGIRGFHSGGILVINSGNYDSFTVDSSFSKILFVQGPSFTQIDANNKTFTVDGCYFGSLINDGNVSYINPCQTVIIQHRYKRLHHLTRKK